MLREIEGWLEYLLKEIHLLDESKVAEAEKRKETERRNRVRKVKKEEQKRLYEERLAKSTARAQAEVIRQQGKPMMFRSAPIAKKKEKEEDTQEEVTHFLSYFTNL